MNSIFKYLLMPLAAGLLLCWGGEARAQAGVGDAEIRLRFEQYEAKLNALLMTRRDEEKEFVAKVVQKVREGVIPEPLVETSYKWVLNKRPGTKYPFVFFERVLRIQAESMEIEIPAFDYNVYQQRAIRR